MSKKVFISYAREDATMVRQFNADIESNGFLTWFDEKDLLLGQNWRVVIPKEIRKSDFFIFMLSTRSVTKRGYVQAEQKIAMDVLDEMPESDIFIIPVRIDDCEVPYSLEKYLYVDLFPDYNQALDKILKTLRA